MTHIFDTLTTNRLNVEIDVVVETHSNLDSDAYPDVEVYYEAGRKLRVVPPALYTQDDVDYWVARLGE